MAKKGFFGWYCEGNHDDDPKYGGAETHVVDGNDEYSDDHERKKRHDLRRLEWTGVFIFVSLTVILMQFNLGLHPSENKPVDLVDGYNKSIPNPLASDEILSLTLNLKSQSLSAHYAIFASASLEVSMLDVWRNATTGELFSGYTMKPLPPYIRVLFNGTSCNVPVNIYDRVFPCWRDLQLDDQYPKHVRYNGSKTIYYTHGGAFDVQLAYPYNDSKDRSSVGEEFILIDSYQVTADFIQAQRATDQWRAIVSLAGIAGILGGIQIYLKLYWYIRNNYNY